MWVPITLLLQRGAPCLAVHSIQFWMWVSPWRPLLKVWQCTSGDQDHQLWAWYRISSQRWRWSKSCGLLWTASEEIYRQWWTLGKEYFFIIVLLIVIPHRSKGNHKVLQLWERYLRICQALFHLEILPGFGLWLFTRSLSCAYFINWCSLVVQISSVIYCYWWLYKWHEGWNAVIIAPESRHKNNQFFDGLVMIRWSVHWLGSSGWNEKIYCMHYALYINWIGYKCTKYCYLLCELCSATDKQ